MQLAHAAQQALAGLRVLFQAQGRVLLQDLLQGLQELVLVRAGGRFDRQAQYGLARLDALQAQQVAGGAEGVAGGGVAQAGEEDDIAGLGQVQGGLLAGIHIEDARHQLVRMRRRRQELDLVAGLELAAVEAGEDVAATLPHLHLEGQGDQGPLGVQGDLLLAAIRPGPGRAGGRGGRGAT